MKKQIIMAVSVVAMFLLMIVTSGQAAVCSPGNIISLQIENEAPSGDASQYKVRVACPSKFSGERVYWLSANLGDSGYATMLTAVSLDSPVHMDMTDYPEGSIVTKIQLVK